VPYFRQLFVIDSHGDPITGYPQSDFNSVPTAPEEQIGIDLALSGVRVQGYSIPPAEGETTAQVTFLASILDDNGEPIGVLIGRADLASNPFTKPILTSLSSLTEIGGEGILLDERGRILVHPNTNRLMTYYSGRIDEELPFFDDTAPDGTRQLVYRQVAIGRPWAVVLTVPARSTQQLALDIAAPLLVLVFILAAFIIILLRVGLKKVATSLQTLALEADRISAGELDHPIMVGSVDEVGQLRGAFDQMRSSLKDRLEDLNRLLLVSQGVASSREMSEAVKPILDSALAYGACSARLLLVPALVPDARRGGPSPSRYGSGSDTGAYSYLDGQLLTLMRDQTRIILTNPLRTPMLTFKPGAPRPESILAVALRHENLYYGTLWVGYDQPHTFTNEEVNLVSTVAGQAAIAASNARLYMTAEIERQRLAAILASSPDPVLVTDRRDNILLLNPAAWQVLGLGMETGVGKPINDVISQPELVQLLRSTEDEQVTSEEVALPGDKIYMATASSVMTEGQRVGRVCMLRDITHLKELDALKSDFVSTVSHDLRSPLTLMRGYATMLEMVGDLNDQQAGYVSKIIIGVENMARLVNNLLDLGRIEADVGLHLQMVSVHEIVDEVTSALSMTAAQKDIQVNIDIPLETVPLVEADEAFLQQALHNLVDNAIKYTPRGGKVWIKVNARRGLIVFEVRDNGIGISPVDQQRLFEKFYRGASREAKRERGTGLGLAIVKSIAERHHGQVRLESQFGKGSRFFLALPIRQPPQ
jgi:PAS domain S-box-containing protein